MILECPACATRYEVPDTAIGAVGRKVRCAKCRHRWYAGAQAADEDEMEGAMPAQGPADAEVAGVGEVAAPADEPGADDPPPAAATGEAQAPVAGDSAAPARRRRLWTWAAIILALMVAAAALAVTFWGLPEWVPGRSPAFAEAAPAELVLDFPRDQQGWRQLPNGTEIFGASGTITNAGATERAVPPILIVLRDSRERIVYSWEVVPPARSLAPGGTVAVNEAVTDAPRSAHFADIGWKPG